VIAKSDQLYVECGLHGARIMSTRLNLTPKCLDGEIDANIQRLKDDLDACAREMKRRVGELRQRGAFQKTLRHNP
jgi:hypothetical protein